MTDEILIVPFSQTGLVKQKFVEAIQNYQTVEQQYRQKYKQRLERQYKIGASQCVAMLFAELSSVISAF